AAHRGRGITLGPRVVAGRSRVLAPRLRAAAVDRSAHAGRQRARARRRAVVTLGDRVGARRRGILAVRPRLAFAGGAEVLVVRRRLLQLAQVHRIGRLGAVGNVGDLPLVARRTHRNRAVAVGRRACAQRHAVGGGRVGIEAKRRGIQAIGPGQGASGGGEVVGGTGAGAQRRRTRAPRLGLESVGDAAHGRAGVAGRDALLADRGAVFTRGDAVTAQG